MKQLQSLFLMLGLILNLGFVLEAHGRMIGPPASQNAIVNFAICRATKSLCDRSRTTFVDLNLEGLTFVDVNFQDVNFTGSSFANADLRGTHMRDTLLMDVNFTGADLRGVNFTRANISGADFTGANVTGAIFDEVIYDASTILPKGFSY